MMQNYFSDKQLVEMTKQLTQAQIEFWRHETILTWRWWFLVAILIIPWFAWYKLADKKRFSQLVLFLLGFLVLTITVDEVLTMLALRIYPHKLIPLLPAFTPLDYTVIPIIFTLAYQRFVAWKGFFWAATAGALFIGFAGEPLFSWLGLNVLIKWKYLYAPPVLLAMGLFCKWLTDKIIGIAQKAE